MERKGSTMSKPERILYEMEITQAYNALREGKLILIPTDALWCLAASIEFPETLKRLKSHSAHAEEEIEVLFPDIPSLKNAVDHLHPRLETLLLYHTRPLAILFDEPPGLPANLQRPDGSMALRVTLDTFVRELTHTLNTAIAVLPVQDNAKGTPAHFGSISSGVIQAVDYVVRYRQNDRNMGEIPVLVRLGTDEELEFIRE
ncbi:MAG: hypothetical protein RL181_766 [Bacteroidota bacterium]|jgi:L-threonylcarbamoyladenylate synthase